MKNIELSAIIACYKDAQAIPIMHKRLTTVLSKLSPYEIIFVNDGSPDNSEAVLAKLVYKDSHVVAVNHSRNFSSQMAFLSGMKIAKGKAVILLDGDLQDPPELIPQLYKLWKKGYEVVYGVRSKREASKLMQLFYKAYYRLFRRLSYIPIPLDAGDFSLIDRKVVEVLIALPERDYFLRGLRAWAGFRQTGVDYVRPERMFGKTTNSLYKNFQWALKGIFSFSYAPLEILSVCSFIVFIIALVALVVQIILRFMLPNTPQGVTTILVAVLFLGAVQLLSISVIGQYIGKMFEEVKKRPQFIVKSILRHEQK